MNRIDRIRLEVQIAAFGQAGLDRVLRHEHPQVSGVKWIVNVQNPEGELEVPEELATREDMEIVQHSDRGLARNRNHGLANGGESELILLGDDDVDYEKEGLSKLIEHFDNHPDADVICGRFKTNGEYVKVYGEGEFDLRRPPKGWYISSIEIAFRRSSLKGLRFNENVGVGSGVFVAGEDTIFLAEMLRRGAKGLGVPVDVCHHNQESTGTRIRTDLDFLKCYGATMLKVKPWSWPVRLVIHAMRTPLPFFRCLKGTLAGVGYALKHRVF